MRPTVYRRNARGPRDRQAFEDVRLQAGALFSSASAIPTTWPTRSYVIGAWPCG